MTTGTREQTIFCELDNEKVESKITVRDFSSGERAIRAFKIGGALWLAAGLAIFIPILHFILVPSLIILGAVFGFATWTGRSEILSGEFICPSCKKTTPLAKTGYSFPKTTRCSGCSLTVKIDCIPSGP
ncbi:MAG: hypothetical protein AB7F86_08075 [Bdellovibrionales bacterium]